MTDDALNGLGKRSALGFVGAAVSGLATIATILIASRALDDQGTGQFFILTSVFAIVQGLCSLGIDAGLQYWLPSTSTAGAHKLLRMTLPIVIVFGVLAAIAVAAGAGFFADLLSHDDAAIGPGVLRTLAIALPFAGFYEVVFGALRALDNLVYSVLIDRVVRPLVQVAAMAAIAFADGSALQMVMAWVIPFAVASVLAATLLVRPRSARKMNGRKQSISRFEFWDYTRPRAIARTAQVLTQRLDVILLGSLASVEQAGIYGTVSRCMIAGVFVATAVQQVVQPKLRRLVVKGDNDSVKTMYGASTTWLMLATWPAYLALAIFAPTILRAFGTRFESGSTALVILCLTMLVASACGLVDVVLLMLGRSWLSTGIVLAALVFNVALNVALIPRFGMEGAAIAWSVAILTTNLVPLWYVRKVGIHPGGPALATAIMTVVAAFGVPMFVGRLVVGTKVTQFLVILGASILIYLIAVLLNRHRLLLDRFFADVAGRRSPDPKPTTVHKDPRAARNIMSDFRQQVSQIGEAQGPDVLSVLRRQLPIIGLATLLGLLGASALALSSKGKYESKATVLVAALKGDTAPGGGRERTVNIETQATVAKSTNLLVLVAEKLGLEETRVRKSVKALAAPTGDILLLSYLDDDPQIALRGAQVISEEYLAQRSATALALIDTTRAQLEETIAQLQVELEDLSVQIAAEVAKNPDAESESVTLQSLRQIQELTLRQQATAKENAAAIKTSVDPGRVVLEPRLPTKRTGTSRPLTMMGGAIAGLFAGITIALFRDRRDDSYRSAVNLSAHGINEIARVPLLSKGELMVQPPGGDARRAYGGLLIQVCFLSGLPGGAFKSLQLVPVESDTLPVSASRTLGDALSFEAYEGGTALALLATAGEDGSQPMDAGSIWENLPPAITELAADHDVVLAVSPPLDRSMNGLAVASLVDRTVLVVSERTPVSEIKGAIESMRHADSVSVVVLTNAKHALVSKGRGRGK